MSWLETLEEIRNRDWSTASADERAAKSREIVAVCSYAGAVTAAVPVPIADLALLLPVQSAMVMTVGHVHGRAVGEAEAKRIALELGAVAGLAFAGHAAIGVLKRLLIPAVGGLLSISATFALTWGLGRVAIAYFANPELSREDLRSVFQEALREGKASFSKEAFERFRKRESASVESSEAPAPDPVSESVSEPPSAAPATETPRREVNESLKVKKRTL